MPETKKTRIAVVDDMRSDRENLIESLQEAISKLAPLHNYAIESFSSAQPVLDKIERCEDSNNPPWHIVLSDALMPSLARGGFQIARAIREKYRGKHAAMKLALITDESSVVAASAELEEFDTPENAAWFSFYPKGRSITEGGDDKDLLTDNTWRFALREMIQLRMDRQWGEALLALYEKRHDKSIIIRSPKSTEMLIKAKRLGQNPSCKEMIIIGESGTGKEALAHFIHYQRLNTLGKELKEPLTKNCKAIDDEFFEKEMFGAVKGAYTGSIVDRKGIFGCDLKGTVFLDEFHRLSKTNQEKMLRFVEDREVLRMGDDNPENQNCFEGMIVFATNQKPVPMIDGGALDDDFYYRINNFDKIEVPPLRERREEIVYSFLDFLKLYFPDDEEGIVLTPDAKDWLASEDIIWRGNFRTLGALAKGIYDSKSERINEITAEDLKQIANQNPLDYFPKTDAHCKRVASASSEPSQSIDIAEINVQNILAGKLTYAKLKEFKPDKYIPVLMEARKILDAEGYDGSLEELASRIALNKPNTLSVAFSNFRKNTKS
jgi:DNA-binding NtrC family response regulator